jgi:serine/threonine protein kinase
MTWDGDVVGTPAFMSPEQARGDLGAMGPATDVYALGAMLYQLRRWCMNRRKCAQAPIWREIGSWGTLA